MRTPDYVRQRVGPMKLKGLHKELSRVIRQQFPRIGGPRMTDLCATLILEIVDRHLLPTEHLRHGQLLWLGFDLDDPPSRGKTMADVRLIPVILDVCTAEDLDAHLDRLLPRERLLRRCLRLSHQAYEQGALLSNIDLAFILGASDSRIGELLAAHEREHQIVVPRRATLHDVGSGVTHKRIICWKSVVEGKTSDQVARETHHTIAAVDRYLGMFDRVRFCRRQSLEIHDIARTLKCTERLVREYIAIDQMLTPEGGT